MKRARLEEFGQAAYTYLGKAPFVLKTANIAVDLLVRLLSNLCLWGAPPAYSGKGRPRKHDHFFHVWGTPASQSLTSSIGNH